MLELNATSEYMPQIYSIDAQDLADVTFDQAHPIENVLESKTDRKYFIPLITKNAANWVCNEIRANTNPGRNALIFGSKGVRSSSTCDLRKNPML